MPPASRFGASKYRNAIPYIPPREEFYRHSLPPFALSSSNATSSAISTFSSEIKTTREWIVTLTASGDLSYRSYAEGSEAKTLKAGSGGGVGDWDVSPLEDGFIAIGGLDGAIAVYSLPPASSPSSELSLVRTIAPPSGSAAKPAVTHLAFHPTTPNILLVSSSASPLVIFDLLLSPPSAAISLNAPDAKGLWSVAWSSDGTRIAMFSKSGILSIYEPRSGQDAIATKSYAFTVQALKPARLVWVGDEIFLSSFSKTRNRQYSLITTKPTLETKFTQSLDTSPGISLPLVDEERKIVYLAGRGDMTLRQIELSGPQGYQETLHSLPYPLASTALALKHPTHLDVMNAEIARVLIPAVDKDGDCILPFGIRVPRRQLIDYHDDLYPDIRGTVPEQTAEEWFKGHDKRPLPFTLDPARRGSWEDRVRQWEKVHDGAGSAANADQATTTSKSAVTEPSAPETSVPDDGGRPSPSQPTLSAESDSHKSSEPIQDPATSSSNMSSASQSLNPDVPPLQDGETYVSTDYKGRIASEYLAAELERHRKHGNKGPLMVGLQGPQGCGKTTLCTALLSYLQEKKGFKAAVLSLDDLYKTHDGLKAVAQKHPDNALLAGRGPPGTHDVTLAVETLKKVQQINDSASSAVDLPIFDKSLCGGEGDRSSDTVKIQGPIDVFILEGWSMGFTPLSASELKARYDNPKPASPQTSEIYFTKHPLSSLETLNVYLTELSTAIYGYFTSFIQVDPVSYDYVFTWRLEQEHHMKAKNGGKGMTDQQVHKFVERYMPGYELWKEGIWAKGTGWEGRGLRLRFGKDREETLADEIIPSQAEQIGTTTVKDGPATDVTPFPPASAAPSAVSSQPQPTSSTRASDLVYSAPSAPSPAPQPTTRSTSAAAPSAPFNPNWSRNFLAGKSPLIPSYDSIPALSSLHQDSRILKANSQFAFFPIQGTGGRLNAHPLSKKGRMSLGGEGYLASGVEMVDFDVELGGEGRVAIAGEDGVIRVWKIPSEGIQGVGPEPQQVLKGKGIDKITEIIFHPTAKDLLVGLTNDHGHSYIRFWDLTFSAEVKQVDLPAQGVFNMAFNVEGDRVAIATKDGRLIVLDPRNPSTLVQGKAHDSPRSFQTTWIDRSHIITVGFSRGSQRKINLYNVPASGSGDITTLYSLTIDVSPSVLFPVYDPDTNILYVWGKGERVIQAYEVHPSNEREPITKLPSFTAGSPQVGVAFMPKRLVDVKKVEVAKALRLTAKTLEEVSFTIPRNKPDFFQDDIYQTTVDVESTVLIAAEWLSGKDVAPEKISLQPEGMTPLSQAPKTDSAAKKKFVPAANVMSEEEKKRKEMDELFAKAKLDESSDEEEQEKRGIDPPDDDW
ncbi:actin cross-linking [Kwoniella heveanensis CBS 569]|nr:actin cross-linking [Kwoniella heveanensis CBS 569]